MLLYVDPEYKDYGGHDAHRRDIDGAFDIFQLATLRHKVDRETGDSMNPIETKPADNNSSPWSPMPTNGKRDGTDKRRLDLNANIKLIQPKKQIKRTQKLKSKLHEDLKLLR